MMRASLALAGILIALTLAAVPASAEADCSQSVDGPGALARAECSVRLGGPTSVCLLVSEELVDVIEVVVLGERRLSVEDMPCTADGCDLDPDVYLSGGVQQCKATVDQGDLAACIEILDRDEAWAFLVDVTLMGNAYGTEPGCTA